MLNSPRCTKTWVQSQGNLFYVSGRTDKVNKVAFEASNGRVMA